MADAGITALRRELEEQLHRCKWPKPPATEGDSRVRSEYDQFVNMPALIGWMTATAPGHDQTNVSRLLAEMNIQLSNFRTRRLQRMDDQSCLHLLGCLLSLGAADLVNIITEQGNITDKTMDQRVPTFRRKKIDEAVRNSRNPIRTVEKSLNLVADFFDTRWAFKPIYFDAKFNVDSTHDLGDHIMPFCARQVVNGKGGTAEVHRVFVPASFISEDIKHCLTEPFQYGSYGQCYDLAIKTFSQLQESTFDRERDAFRGLRGQEGIVRCFGSYTSRVWDDETGEGLAFNLVLEYSPMDLDGMYQRMAAPRSSDKIISSWEMIFEVSKAIKNIHLLKVGDENYNGWHGDIKPDNILVLLENGQQRLKLADFGFAEFVESVGPGVPVTTVMQGVTEGFGAPDPGDEKDQSIDIWSFGCVLSVHATWILGGYDAVRQFQQYRQNIHRRLAGDSRKSSAFHDGHSILPEIHDWHQHWLGQSKCVSDNITDKVLEFVKTRMLQRKEKRIAAEKLCTELYNIISAARAEPVGAPSIQIMSPHFHEDMKATDSQDRAMLSKAIHAFREKASMSSRQTLAYHQATRGPSQLSRPNPRSEQQISGGRVPQASPPASLGPTIQSSLTMSSTGSRIETDSQHRVDTPLSSRNEGSSVSGAPHPKIYVDAKMLLWNVVNGEDTDATITTVQDALSDRPDFVKDQDSLLRTPVMRAVVLPLRDKRNFEILQLLLEPSDLTKEDADGYNILHHLACALGKYMPPLSRSTLSREITSIFSRQNVQEIANVCNHDDDEPLHLATKAKQLVVVEILCNIGAKPRTEHLHLAIDKNSDDIVRFYIERYRVQLDTGYVFDKKHWNSREPAIRDVLLEIGVQDPNQRTRKLPSFMGKKRY